MTITVSLPRDTFKYVSIDDYYRFDDGALGVVVKRIPSPWWMFWRSPAVVIQLMD